MSLEDDKRTENTNIEEPNKNDLIDDNDEIEEKNKEEEHENDNDNENENDNEIENDNENENNISNGLNEQVESGINEMNEKPKLRKYTPKTEQEAIKARIINLEMNEKPRDEHPNDTYDFHMHDNLETGNGQIEKFRIPPELKKTFIIVMILAILGVTLIICGFIKAISDATPGGGIMFWVLGTVVIIPGGFYSYQFYKAKKAKEEYRRQDILDNIPQL